jgi:lipopolysaccharide biosynthesis glycosyltransferase
MDMGSNCCAAALDCLGEPYYELFGIYKGKYCNSGVILIDLNKWKEQGITEKVKDCVHQNKGYVFFMEQSVFNIVLQGNIAYIPAIYNTSTIMQMFSPKELWRMRKPKYFYNDQEIEMAVQDPTIIHMTGLFYVINKPWNEVTNHPSRKLFWLYFELLDWKKEEIQDDNRNIRIRIRDYIVHIIPKDILVPFIEVAYNFIRVKYIKRKIRITQKD